CRTMSAHTAPKTRGFSLKCSERTRGHRVSILPRNCSAICVWSKSASKTATRLAPCERNWKMRSGRAILIYVAPTCEFGRLRRWEKDEDDHPFCRASLPCRPASWPRLVHVHADPVSWRFAPKPARSEEHTSELQSHLNLVCRLLLEKKNKQDNTVGKDLIHQDQHREPHVR